ncbi:MAG: methyltransferase domain-containing protein [Anaerolineales bacterium]
MKTRLLKFLRCPSCQRELQLIDRHEVDGEVESGRLVCADCDRAFIIRDFVPRFVPAENYAGSFGLQWNRFRETQLDSHSGVPISTNRFFRQTEWHCDTLGGKLVLDAGCGAGRFAEVALSCDADLIAIDYSTAVDACWQNLGRHPNLHVVQADIYQLPFQPGNFDFVYSLGVLQHTPDVERAFMALTQQLATGGRLVVDLYLWNLGYLFHPKTWLRPFSTRLEPQRLFGVVERWTPRMLTVSRSLGRIPLLGRYLKRLIPVADYEGVYPLSDDQLLEWGILDTYDWLSPRYDQPQTAKTLRRWLEQANLQDIEVFKADHLTGRGRRVAASGEA